MTTLLTISGSLRKGSFNTALLRALPDLGPPGTSFRPAPSYAAFPLYNADEHQATGIPEAVTDFAEAVRAADAVVIATPEYNWSIPGGLKNALDWISRVPDHPFKRKPVLIQSATAGPLGGARMQYHLRMAMTFLDSQIFGTPEVFVGMAHTKFDPATGVLTDEPTRALLSTQLAAFVDFTMRVAG